MADRAERSDIARSIEDYLHTVGLRSVFAVYSLSSRTWIYSAKVRQDRPAKDFGSRGFVAVMLSAQHVIDVGTDSEPDWVDVLSFVQDCVVDELGFGWPELHDEGRFVDLLRPGLAGGRLVWLHSQQEFVPVGSLAGLSSGTIKRAP